MKMNKNTKDMIRLFRYFPELMADLLLGCPYPASAEAVSDWTADNEYRLFDFGEFNEWNALAFYSGVDYGVLSEWVNRKHQRGRANTP